MSQPQEPDRARRRFLKTLGIAGITTALGPAARSLAQTAPAGPAIYPPGVPPPKGAKPAAGNQPEAPSEDARALAAIIRRRYGKSLNTEQIASITRDFDGDLQAGKRLHDFKLTNGDEPDVNFHA